MNEFLELFIKLIMPRQIKPGVFHIPFMPAAHPVDKTGGWFELPKVVLNASKSLLNFSASNTENI